MQVSDEAVEAAVEAMRRLDWRSSMGDYTRAALEAAAPYMVAERSLPPLAEAEWDDLRQLPHPYRSKA